MATTTINQPASRIFERAICLAVSLSRPGTKKKVKSGAVEVAADPAFIHVSKDLLQCPEMRAIEQLDGEIRRYVAGICLPNSMFKGGVYLIPTELVLSTDKRLEDYAAQRQALVEDAVGMYPTRQAEAIAKLGVLADATDYPPIDRFAAAFAMQVKYLTLGVPEVLAAVSQELYEREQRKAQASVVEATDEIIAVLRLSFMEMVEHMVERTAPDPTTGKSRVFKNTLVTNLTGFLDSFHARNITDDQQLAALVDQAKTILGGVTPQQLRDSHDLRTYVNTGMAQIRTNLDQLVTSTRTRSIMLEDAEPSAGEAAA